MLVNLSNNYKLQMSNNLVDEKVDLKEKFINYCYVNGIFDGKKKAFEMLKINPDTERYLLDKLKNEGYYSSTRLEINLPLLGLGRFAWVFVSLNWSLIDEEKFINKVLSLPHVHTIAEITGNFDFAIKIFGPSMQVVSSFIMAFEKVFSDEIVDTQVMFAVNEYKRHYSVLKNEKHVDLKSIDLTILEEKNKDPSKSLYELSKKIGAHRNTISNRWKFLWKSNIITKESLDLTEKGYNKIKMNLKAFIIVHPSPGATDKIARALTKINEVQDVFSTTQNEIVAVVRLQNSDSLAFFHKKVFRTNKYIKKTNTIIFLTKKTRSYMTREELNSALGRGFVDKHID